MVKLQAKAVVKLQAKAVVKLQAKLFLQAVIKFNKIYIANLLETSLILLDFEIKNIL